MKTNVKRKWNTQESVPKRNEDGNFESTDRGYGTKIVSLFPIPVSKLLENLQLESNHDSKDSKQGSKTPECTQFVFQIIDVQLCRSINQSLRTFVHFTIHWFLTSFFGFSWVFLGFIGKTYEEFNSLYQNVAVQDHDFELKEKTIKVENELKTFQTSVILKKPHLQIQNRFNYLFQNSSRITLKFIIKEPMKLADFNILKPPYVQYEFPGSLPESLVKSNIKDIYDEEFFQLMSIKSNGMRFVMMIGIWFNTKMVLLYDRANHIYQIPIRCPDVFYRGCILDGELTQLTDPNTNQLLPNRYSYKAFDCLMSQGNICGQRAYLHRLQIMELLITQWSTVLSSLITPSTTQKPKKYTVEELIQMNKLQINQSLFQVDDPMSPLVIRAKHMVPIQRAIDLLIDGMHILDESNDGFMLSAGESKSEIGRTSSMKKVKRYQGHVIDFGVKVCVMFDPPTINTLCL